MVPREAVTGVVLAGGEGRRVGGVDKGLLTFEGQALALGALQRLRPQVGPLAVSANRNLQTYAGFGVPVWPDERAGFEGPLAGWLAALRHCRTPWMASVPCDVPGFPLDLVARLGSGVDDSTDVVIATAGGRPHPVFALMRASLAPRLEAALHQGERRVMGWVLAQRHAEVDFPAAEDFRNLNSPRDFPPPVDTNG